MNVLFVCGSNTVRSPIAEKLLGVKSGFTVDSAGIVGGISTQGLVDDKTGIDMVAEARFTDTSEHSSKMVDQDLIDWADVVLYMQSHMLNKLVESFGENTKYAPLDPNGEIPSSDYISLTRDASVEGNYWYYLRKQISESVDAFASAN